MLGRLGVLCPLLSHNTLTAHMLGRLVSSVDKKQSATIGTALHSYALIAWPQAAVFQVHFLSVCSMLNQLNYFPLTSYTPGVTSGFISPSTSPF